jgi:hypothetical protein
MLVLLSLVAAQTIGGGGVILWLLAVEGHLRIAARHALDQGQEERRSREPKASSREQADTVSFGPLSGC